MRVLRAALSNFALVATLGFILPAVSAQSTDQNYPTPITSTEISGTIKARDIGDTRLTSYFYAFEGSQGDIFINVVAKNFSGDIDVYNAEGLRPLAKIVIYADAGTTETGRLIYLRKAERLILRIEGRTPNDDPAHLRIKFGGSFIALAPQKAVEAPTIAPTSAEETAVKVNSVGTIIPAVPKPPPAREIVSEQVTPKPTEDTRSEPSPPVSDPPPADKSATDTVPETVFENKSAKVVVTPEKKAAAKRPSRRAASRVATSAAKTETSAPEEKKPDPLASIRLIVQLKDGESIERPMNEVVKFSVDKGVLTVILKGGKITRYSILDVARVTIE
ncbi:MAG TPA: hypothetical protein VNA17_00175 [Pyrinomonadaceae bacterium]|nr:hypothetical protein [Pyrinomonadaceae bacterium]